MGENVWKNQRISDFSLSCGSVGNLVLWRFLLKGRKSPQSRQNFIWVEHFVDFAFVELCCFRTQKRHRKYILERMPQKHKILQLGTVT